MKSCYICKESYLISEFHKDKSKKDGLDSRCKICAKIQKSEYYKNNKQLIIKNTTEYRRCHMESYTAARRKREIINKQTIDSNRRIRENNRRKNDLIYRLKQNLSRRVRSLINGKTKRTIDILDCSVDKLKEHLENQFQPGMTWENYGKWHIDHIYPLSRAINKEELEKLYHYTNLQPLWAIDNIKKGNKIL